MRATYEWLGPTGKLLAKGTLYGESTLSLSCLAVENAIAKGAAVDPPVTKWDRLVVTIYNTQ